MRALIAIACLLLSGCSMYVVRPEMRRVQITCVLASCTREIPADVQLLQIACVLAKCSFTVGRELP